MADKKVIFVTAFHSFITKNLLNTEAFSVISGEQDLTTIILVPELKKDFFERTYARENVQIVGVDVPELISRKEEKRYSYLSKQLIQAHYPNYKARERFDANKSLIGLLKYLADIWGRKVLSSNRYAQALFRKKFIEREGQREIRDIFDKYQPDAVFSTDAFDEGDILIAREAKKSGVPLLSMVRSWDNCYSKGLLRVMPDRLIVNNDTIKEEAVNVQGVPGENVFVLGSPQYDIFINNPRMSKSDFFKLMKLDPKKKLVLFAPAGTLLSNTDDDIVAAITDAIDQNKVASSIQVLVRNHPNHPARLNDFKRRSDVVVEEPGVVFNPQNPKDTELTASDNEHLADTLYHSDVVVWVATTLGLDALVYDKPGIMINYDGRKKLPYNESVKKYHDEDHMDKMLKLEGITVVDSEEELIDSINHYIKDPMWNEEGRQRVLAQQFYKLDGQAGARIGKYVVDFVREINRSN